MYFFLRKKNTSIYIAKTKCHKLITKRFVNLDVMSIQTSTSIRGAQANMINREWSLDA